MIKSLVIIVLSFAMSSCADTSDASLRFISLTVKNKTDSDLTVTVSDGIKMTGKFLAATRSGTEGFGTLRLENKAIVTAAFPGNRVFTKEFKPNIEKIPRMGKYPELIFVICSDGEIKMGYTVVDIIPGREYLELDGESSEDFNRRVANDDFVFYSGWGTLDQIKLSVKNGAGINARNDFGMSALMMAVSHEKVDNIQYIMTMDPDLQIKNGNGENVFDLAKGNKQLIKIIRKEQ